MNDNPAALHAVWTGRFQPPHNGHLAVLRHSLAVLPLPHVAVLTTHFGWSSRGAYADHAAEAYAPTRNPLTVWERLSLMRLALAGAGFADRVTLVVAPRHDLGWETVSQFYPPHRVICLTRKDAFESAKEELWRSRGERVNVFHSLGPENVLTTTAIRAAVATGADWHAFIPEACHRYFVDIDGPRRIFGLSDPTR